jgi:5'-deoxynucleotidase YfbR-like HD superfamily hydrolase
LFFYSVAEHSVLMSRLVSEEAALYALMHDAPEAYLADVVRPIKQVMPELKEAESLLWDAIAERFALRVPEHVAAEVKIADRRMLATEKARVIADGPDWESCADIAPFDVEIEGWSPALGYLLFMKRFEELTGRAS